MGSPSTQAAPPTSPQRKGAENDEGTNPFSRPSNSGAAPGIGVFGVPKDVLTAWGLPYAGQGCAEARLPEFPSQ